MLPFTRKLLEDWAGKDAFSSGMRLFENEAVKKATYKHPEIRGFIERPPRGIKTGLVVQKNGPPENRCPCPDSRDRDLFCSHAVALCLELLKIYNDPARLEKLEQERRRAERLKHIDESEYIQRVPANQNNVSANLQLEINEGWQKALEEKRPITLNICLAFDDNLLPIHKVPRNLPFHFEKTQENLLFVLEDIAEGPAPGKMEITLNAFCGLLEILPDQVLRDANNHENIRVNQEKISPHLMLELDHENGELILMLRAPFPDQTPLCLIAQNRGWILHKYTFHRLQKILPGPLQNLYRNPVYIERKSVPNFMETELPMLRNVIEVQTDVTMDWFDLKPMKPNFFLIVKGSPASLAIECYACYEDLQLPAGKATSAGNFCLPDPENMMAYNVRDMPTEKRALGQLNSLGVNEEENAVIGKRHVMNFIASAIPLLRRQGWKVEILGRVASYLEEVQSISPIVRIHSPENAGWFEVNFDFEHQDGDHLSAAEIQRAIRMGDSFVERKGKTIMFDSDAITTLNAVFEDCASGESSRSGAFRMDSIFSPYVQSSLGTLGDVIVKTSPEWMKASRRQNREMKLETLPIKEPLKSTLRPYQKDGVNWLHFLAQNNFCGILADDMGLGKTLQTLAWIQYLPRQHPVLIICPTSLVENWIEEAVRFTPQLRVSHLTGTRRHKHWSDLDAHDIIITSYALIRRDLEKYIERQFSVIVLDEAQHIKNRSTQNAIAAKSLNGKHRLVLTGTPLENSVSDLWSIMDFLMPGYLGSHTHFKTFYETPISQGGNAAEKAQQKLKRKLHPFLLRRLKNEVAKDLPQKIEKTAFCGMTKDQRLVYQELLKSARNQISDMVAQQGFNKSRMHVLKNLLRLRQASCHLALLKLPDLNSQQPSGKMELFFELLEEALDGGHRMLLFSQFTSMLAILRSELDRQNISYLYLDGSTPNRQELVHKFNKDESIPVFLISLKAGGTGLNLTGADMVIHFDPWWNPAVEDQATDRAYRIGQQRNVYALKLITKGSVEEKVLEMQRKKKSIIDATMSSDEKLLNKLDWDDIQELLS